MGLGVYEDGLESVFSFGFFGIFEFCGALFLRGGYFRFEVIFS